jgi:hypothetical protein
MEEGGLVYEGKWENGMKHGQAWLGTENFFNDNYYP